MGPRGARVYYPWLRREATPEPSVLAAQAANRLQSVQAHAAERIGEKRDQGGPGEPVPGLNGKFPGE